MLAVTKQIHMHKTNIISGRSWMATINSQEENDFLCNFPGRAVSTEQQNRFIYLCRSWYVLSIDKFATDCM